MQSNYDAIIVGAGPAGSTCALYAARAGLKVLLLDKKSFPRDKICGDAISGRSVEFLEELGLLEKLKTVPQKRVTGVTFSSPNGVAATVPFTPPATKKEVYGFVCRREIYDNMLFEAAKAEVETQENFEVKTILRENGAVVGVSGLDANGDEKELTAKVVIGADGFNSIISQQLGIYEHDPNHWVVATRAYYRNVKDVKDAIEIHFVDAVQPGYFWIFPLEDNKVNVGIGMLHRDLKSRNISLRQAHLDAVASDYFKDRFDGAELISKIQGWNLPVGSKKRQVIGDGFMLLGDAAGLIDPFTGEGIGNAMCSGKLAAETLKQVAASGKATAKHLKSYEQKLWATLWDELHTSHLLQRIGRFQPLLNLVVGRAAKSEEVRLWISAMMAGTLSRRMLANPMTYMRLLFK